MLKESGDKVEAADKGEVESALAEAKEKLAGTPSAAELDAAKEKLQTASHKLAEAIYKAGPTPAGEGNGPAAEAHDTHEHKKDEGVIDAEYVDAEK
jgi:molecular chaperone DnaK